MSRKEQQRRGKDSPAEGTAKAKAGSMNQLSTFAKCKQFSVTKAESLN